MEDNEGRTERVRDLIAPTPSRELVARHVEVCAPCSALLAFAYRRLDADALRSWGGQLVEHLVSELYRRRMLASRNT